MKKVNILASEKYQYLKQNLLKNRIFKDVSVEYKRFPDGERYFRIKDSASFLGLPAVYIFGTIDDEAILEAYNLSCSIVREGCSSLHLVLPYFGYSTMERALKAGEVVSAKNMAHLFSSIPPAPQGNYIYLIDLHAHETQYYFEQNIHPVHLTTEPVIDKIIAEIKKKSKEVVLASADMGRAKWVEQVSNRLGLESAFIMKKRISETETVAEAVNVNVNVKNKNVIILDDMIRMGSSVISAAETYKSMGAKDIYVICVHGVFVDGSIEKIKNSGMIKALYVTNTHAKTQYIQDSFIKIQDISDIISKGLKV